MTDAAASSAQAAPADQPEINWTVLLLGFAGMVVGQFMAILDIQIVAASLPQIQAGVGASALRALSAKAGSHKAMCSSTSQARASRA